ncbi:hypothetical protein ACM26V_03325 [Salipaludibacillus sp. HK11]|uniref:hypothetical protein n=1 Tax=Salipaludibacillus sp. HK11 TaxID=3394320 RepID=UPI0039FC98B5
MSKTKKIFILISFILLIVAIGLSLYSWIQLETFYIAPIVILFTTLAMFFQALNLHDPEAGNKNDEMTDHIKTKSGRISYVVLLILAVLILLISEGGFNANNMDNIPLLLVVGLMLIVQPITEFLYSKKYK